MPRHSILISLIGISLCLAWPIKITAYFVAQITSSVLVVRAGDWRSPTLSFWLTKKNNEPYLITEVIHNSDFVTDLSDWQVIADVTHQSDTTVDNKSWARIALNPDSASDAKLNQSLASSDHPRWLAFRYRLNSDSKLCDAQFVPVRLYFDQKLIWYLTYSPCQNPAPDWQTTIVSLPQSSGELSFRVKTEQSLNLNFDVTRVTTFAAGLTSQENIEVQASETTDLTLPSQINYIQEGYQILSYQVKDLAGKNSPVYLMSLIWQADPPQLSQPPTLFRDNQEELSLLLTFHSSNCVDLTFDSDIVSAPVVPWLNWGSQNQVICPQNQPIPVSVSLSAESHQLKMSLTGVSGIQTITDLITPPVGNN